MDINQKLGDDLGIGGEALATMPSHTTLKVSKELSDELKLVGRKGETYEQIIWRLLSERKKEKETLEKLIETIDKVMSFKSSLERQEKKDSKK